VYFAKTLMGLLAVAGLGAALAHDHPTAPTGLSESDFLGELPTVLSVSRLAQTLPETPGAVTLLDREFIRMSGARDVVDLLRLVPGFQTSSSFHTDVPSATYHGHISDWANRIQVLVDGRSVYSGLLAGSSGTGWHTLALDDIERIEILRGSNSATYGARAFLGVVSIVSRDARETLGLAGSVTRGENGVSDQSMRYGWHLGDAHFRLSADALNANGLEGEVSGNHTERVNLVGHFPLEHGADLQLRAGATALYAGRGELNNIGGNPARRWASGARYVQADWSRPINGDQDLHIAYAHTENFQVDRFPFLTPSPYYGGIIDASGTEVVDNLSIQHGLRLSPELRMAWGGEWRHEDVQAAPLYDGTRHMESYSTRLFGSAEWRMAPGWLLNLGGLLESTNADGDTFTPRAMVNWELAPAHTLRAGVSSAFRTPSTFEKFARVRFFDAQGQHPTPYQILNLGTVGPERLIARELGYHYGGAAGALQTDVRLYQEQVTDGILESEDPSSPFFTPQTYRNSQNYNIQGLEWQLQWQASPATRIYLTQSWTDMVDVRAAGVRSLFRTAHSAPRYGASLALMHHFADGWSASLTHQQADDMALLSISDNPWLASMQRTDLRLARQLRLGGKRVELAATVQNMGERYRDGDWKLWFHQRGLLTVSFEP